MAVFPSQIVRVLEANVQNGGQRQYFIHYVGWKSKWDKWVNPSELLKVRAAVMVLSSRRAGGAAVGS